MSQELIIADTKISITDGLYRINDLHKAAGKSSKDQPAKWLELEQTQSYIEFLLKKLSTENLVVNKNQVITVVVGGNKSGTYACKELVYKYAAWISHDFEYEVIRAYDQLVNNSAQYELQLDKWRKVMLLEKPSEWQLLYTESFYKPVMRLFGWDFAGNKGGLPAVIGHVTRRWIYEVVVPSEILAEIDDKKDSEKIHQWFSEQGGREKLSNQIMMVSGIAKTCRTYGEFKIKAGCVFDDTPLQLEMF